MNVTRSPYTRRQRVVIDNVRFILRYDPMDVVSTAARLQMKPGTLETTLRRAGRRDLIHRMLSMKADGPREWKCESPSCAWCRRDHGRPVRPHRVRRLSGVAA